MFYAKPFINVTNIEKKNWVYKLKTNWILML